MSLGTCPKTGNQKYQHSFVIIFKGMHGFGLWML